MLLRSRSVHGSVCGSEELSCSPRSDFILAPTSWLRIPRRRRCQIPTAFHTTCNICSALTRLTAASQTAPRTQYYISLCCIQVNIVYLFIYFWNPSEVHWNSTWRRSKDRLWSINCCYAPKSSLQTICSATGADVRWLFSLGSVCFSSFIFPVAITMCAQWWCPGTVCFAQSMVQIGYRRERKLAKPYTFYEKEKSPEFTCLWVLSKVLQIFLFLLLLQKMYFTVQELSLHRTFSGFYIFWSMDG